MSYLTYPKTREKARILRQNMTQAEKVLWQRLRANQLGIKFRRQVPIGHYIVDFLAHANNLVIELDGSHHYTPEQMAYDQVRTEYLQGLGIEVIRYDNHSVLTQTDVVVADILGLATPT